MTRDPSKRFMGKPCKRGHSGERYVSGNDCVECKILRKNGLIARKPRKTLEEMRAAIRQEVAEIMKAPI